MLNSQSDSLISLLTVKIQNPETLAPIGTGIIFYSENLKDKVYILTAAHCLFQDRDLFQYPYENVRLNIYCPEKDIYIDLIHDVNKSFLNYDLDKDVAILLLEKFKIESITGTLPIIECLKERSSISKFVSKGFPQATQGKELACIYPIWLQSMIEVNKFQLQLLEDYNDYSIEGFSGSGVFLHTNNKVYLYGIFARYRKEEKGKVIYCQYIETVNQLLEKNFLPTIPFTFLGEHGLNPEFFKRHIDTSLSNLGPRFNQKLNFRLPIATLFNDIAKDEFFKYRLLKCIDEWLLAPDYSSYNKNVLIEIDNKYNILHTFAREWITKIRWEADQLIELNKLKDQVNKFSGILHKKRNELFDLRFKMLKEDAPDKKKSYSYSLPYEQEIIRLQALLSVNNDFLTALENVNIQLSNHPFLIIHGEAGCGKSHLLGDIALERIKNNKPAILLLGQCFKKMTIWDNIKGLLDVTCNKSEFLNNLNNIGKQIGTRFLIFIDALNEGAGREFWYDELPGFISELSDYPFIGLVITVRTTYYNDIIPISVQSDSKVTKRCHEGFKGNEYGALRLFCEFYELDQPHFPLLTPEFTRPLFLQLVCIGLKASGQKTFPRGFQGVNKLLSYYVKAINDKLSRKDEYRLSPPQLVLKAINIMAHSCYEQEFRVLPLEAAVELFSNKFPQFPNLLNDLIQESIFIRNLSTNYNAEGAEEIIYFAYERFADFFIAEQLLQPYTTSDQVKTAFQKGNILGKLLEGMLYGNKGIIDALSVFIPEKFNLEIIEVYDWVFKSEKNGNLLGNIDEWLNECLLESLNWRTIESINDKKLLKWFRSENFNISYDKYLYKLIELTAIHGHSFNSDRLHRNLIQYSMPERDSFWQLHLMYFAGIEDNENASPIRRLIDWAWEPEISLKTDNETARLVCQALAWVLSSTNRKLRDQATKAMVNLLEEKPDALLSILKTFEAIDDLFLLERLYAVAYGCSLRTRSVNSIQKVAQYIYDFIFRHGPPNHILLRDYARNIIEYSIYQKLPIEGDINLICPPYLSKMPNNILTEDEVEKFRIEYDAQNKGNGREKNQIFLDVMNWDFGKYTIGNKIENFSIVSFTMEKECEEFLKTLKREQKSLVKEIIQYFELISSINKLKEGLIKRGEETNINLDISKFDKKVENIKENLKTILEESQLHFLQSKLIPHFKSKIRAKDRHNNIFDSTPIKCWVVQRCFDLGYDSKKHDRYDSIIRESRYSHNNEIEKISTKYQWIATHEIMAIVTDNFKLKEYLGWNAKYQYYKGPWQLYFRDIDPAFTTKNKPENDTKDDLGITPISTNWWFDANYNYWNQSSSNWVRNIKDLPDLKNIIQRTDNSKNEWLYLNSIIDWCEPKPVGQDRYQTHLKSFWYMIKGYLIRKKDMPSIVNLLKNRDFRGRMPESSSMSSLINRENYWSPLAKEYQKSEKNWQTIENTSYKAVIATSEAVGEMNNDKSGAHFSYEMPCKTLFEGMKIKYAPTDGEFENMQGEIIALNVSPKGILIRKKDLIQFLNENNMEIMWTVLCEKHAHSSFPSKRAENHSSIISGIYFLENGTPSGFLSLLEEY